MPIQYVTGDLFLSKAHTIAHGVNCEGKMGAGVAVEFRRFFPDMYKEYRKLCHKNILKAGSYFLWKEGTPWVLNLATQSGKRGAKIYYVENVLQCLAENCGHEGISSIALPRIASGLGGLKWGTVKSIIDTHLGELSIPVVVYENYIQGLEAEEAL